MHNWQLVDFVIISWRRKKRHGRDVVLQGFPIRMDGGFAFALVTAGSAFTQGITLQSAGGWGTFSFGVRRLSDFREKYRISNKES